MRTPNSAAVGVLLALSLGAPAAMAGAILSPAGVVRNTLGTFVGGACVAATDCLIDYTRDQSGIPAFVSGVTDFATYVSGSPSHAAFDSLNAWASSAGVFVGDIDYDLGAIFGIDQFAMWGQGNDQAIGSFSIYTADNPGFAGAALVGDFVGDLSTTAQTFALTPSVGQFVRLRVNGALGGTCCTTLGEVAFDVSAVPEPGTLALLGLGLAGLAATRRRKT